MSEPIQSIAQNNYILHNIDAKKLYVQEPLFTANSGDAVYVGWRPDETVLWSGSTATGTLTLSGDISAYKHIEITVKDQNGYNNVQKFDSSASGFNVSLLTTYPGQTNKIIQRFGLLTATDQSHLNYVSGGRVVFSTGANDFAMISGPNVISIIGINRKENA